MAKASTFNLTTVKTAVKWKMLKDLEGKVFCQTGTMSLKRPEMVQLILACGGATHDVINNSVDFLIVPTDDGFRKGSKYNAAQERGVKIITESEFCEMILPTVEELRNT